MLPLPTGLLSLLPLLEGPLFPDGLLLLAAWYCISRTGYSAFVGWGAISTFAAACAAFQADPAF